MLEETTIYMYQMTRTVEYVVKKIKLRNKHSKNVRN